MSSKTQEQALTIVFFAFNEQVLLKSIQYLTLMRVEGDVHMGLMGCQASQCFHKCHFEFPYK